MVLGHSKAKKKNKQTVSELIYLMTCQLPFHYSLVTLTVLGSIPLTAVVLIWFQMSWSKTHIST